MLAKRVILRNWRNFLEAEVPLWSQNYVLGANATGKSNFLDVFRFLKDISKLHGGGLQQAAEDRGGVSKLRCLHARRDPSVRIHIDFVNDIEDKAPAWRYSIAFKPDPKHPHIAVLTEEQVWKGNKLILTRPSSEDKKDPERLRQTHLEQIQSNSEFRPIGEYFSSTTYLNLVPQLLKYSDQIGGKRLDGDPYGQGFLEHVAKTPSRSLDSRLKKMQTALASAVPQFAELKFERDRVTGRPHLKARYEHHRPNAGWQTEDMFSDGTLRLIGLLWSVLEGNSLLLLEEPEISLNDAIVREIPYMLQQVQRDKRRRRQIIVSTHSEALLSNQGIDGRGVLIIEPAREGSQIRVLNQDESAALNAGFSVAEVVLPKTKPTNSDLFGAAL